MFQEQEQHRRPNDDEKAQESWNGSGGAMRRHFLLARLLACLLRLPVESARRSFLHEWNGWMLGKNSGFAQQARQTGCLDAGMKGLLFDDQMPMGSSAALLLTAAEDSTVQRDLPFLCSLNPNT